MKKRIIITGGNGQDATILNKLLPKKKYHTYLIVNKTNSKNKINATTLKIDLLDIEKIKSCLVKIKPHAIIHLAAKNYSSPNKKNMNYDIFYKQNYLITLNLINSLINVDKNIKFIFAGSSQMFLKKKGIVDENSKFKSSCYYSK